MYIEYKGFYIEYNLYNHNEYSVQYNGDDIIFKTKQAAKNFIDKIYGGILHG